LSLEVFAMSLMQQAKRVLNQAIDRLRKIRFPVQNTDDSVEAQADTLRLWMWASAAGLALIVVVTIVSRAANEDSAASTGEPEIAIADQMPSGFVLVPIEPVNLDALDSVFGQHGYADLYRADDSRQKGRRLLRGVALVRSARNSRRFAVLVPETESTRLPQLAEPVLVILRKGPALKDEGPSVKIVGNKKARTIRKIDLFEEGAPEAISLNPAGESL
jgi:hypothetical protein